MRFFNALRKGAYGLCFFLLFGIVILTCIDVFGRYVLGHALNGTTELTEIGTAILVFSVFPFVSFDSEHVRADIIGRYYPKWFLRLQDVLIDLMLCFGLFFIAQRLYVFAEKSMRRTEVSEFLGIPGWIVPGMISIVCLLTIPILLYKQVVLFRGNSSSEISSI